MGALANGAHNAATLDRRRRSAISPIGPGALPNAGFEWELRRRGSVPGRLVTRCGGGPHGLATAGRRRGGAGTGREGRYKRPFDLAVLGLGLIALLPVWPAFVAAVALAIRLAGPGPVLYRQVRAGREGREFRILKFRTMAPDAEERTGPVWATWNDARATPVGRLLRRFHLDELPQVVNVLRGEMSLVGPRPERPELAARIEPTVPGFSRRLRVRPGIAGLAQARGGSGIRPRDKLRYDLCYIEAMGPWLDLRLCVLCVWKALRPGVARRRCRARRSVAGGTGEARPGARLGGGSLGAGSFGTGL